MPTFYDRYQAGEHTQVWSELIALGEAVRKPPIYADAVAVASETMQRAQLNVETLITRLHALGYRFQTAASVTQQATERMASLTRQMEVLRGSATGPLAGRMKGLFDLIDRLSASSLRPEPGVPEPKVTAESAATIHPLDDASVYSRATTDSAQAIADAESRLGGPLPISLKAWYEKIENVSLLGSHPELNPTEPEQAEPRLSVSPSVLQGPRGQRLRERAESLGFGLADHAPAPSLDQDALPDPLVIAPLEDLVGEIDEGDQDSGPFMIAPDDLQKANISGDVYYVDLPDSSADFMFQDWRDDYFVEYLRRVFKWGGFPGWERHRNPPTKLIEELTQGLLPI